MKKIISRKIISASAAAATAAAVVFSFTGCFAASGTADKTSQRIIINGTEQNPTVYSIDGSNYFKIRDVAYYIGFGVDYDAATDTVNITSAANRDSGTAPAADTESAAVAAEVQKSAQTVMINGEKCDVEAYNINGSNYFKIRDLAEYVDFGCIYNDRENRIELCSDFGYNSADVWGRAKAGDALKITVIDVGQGDSILIEFPENGGEMLIDAGTSSSSEHIINYLEDELPDGKLEYVIATHPHADHIGGMTSVINAVDIDTFYNSKLSHTSKTYTNMAAALIAKSLGTDFSVGETVWVSDNVYFTFLAPVSDYGDDLNNSSTVIKLTYNDTDFLFMGDAEEESETDILSSGADVSADVIKVGHHGSSTSSSQAFVNAVGAKYAAASMGIDNSYGHPHTESVTRWQTAGAAFLATATLGDVVITSDGEAVKAYPDTDYKLR